MAYFQKKKDLVPFSTEKQQVTGPMVYFQEKRPSLDIWSCT